MYVAEQHQVTDEVWLWQPYTHEDVHYTRIHTRCSLINTTTNIHTWLTTIIKHFTISTRSCLMHWLPHPSSPPLLSPTPLSIRPSSFLAPFFLHFHFSLPLSDTHFCTSNNLTELFLEKVAALLLCTTECFEWTPFEEGVEFTYQLKPLLGGS